MRTYSIAFVVAAVTLGAAFKEESMVNKMPPLRTTIDLTPTLNGTTAGKLEMKDVGEKDVELTGDITNLKPGNYVVHVHKPMGCKTLGQGHDAANHHADMGVITADEKGTAKVSLRTPGRLGGTEPITSYCVVIYPPDLSGYLAHGTIFSPGGFVGH
jgi:Cu/Zn superoxide dismutase